MAPTSGSLTAEHQGVRLNGGGPVRPPHWVNGGVRGAAGVHVQARGRNIERRARRRPPTRTHISARLELAALNKKISRTSRVSILSRVDPKGTRVAIVKDAPEPRSCTDLDVAPGSS
jgi:hypothetical protein